MKINKVSIFTEGLSNVDSGELLNRIATFPDLGHSSKNFFDGKLASIYTIKDVHCIQKGVFTSRNNFIIESSLLGLYPRMLGTDDEVNYLTGLGECFSNFPICGSISEASYCVNSWDVNYQHFIVETLPKIHLVYLKSNSPIVVMDVDHIREIVSISYPDRHFIFLKPGEKLHVSTLHLPMPVAQNFEPLVELQIAALLNLRERIPNVQTEACGDVYLARKNVKGMAGQHRRIVNESEVFELFELKNVFIDDFAGKTLSEKSILASSYRNSYTPIGANLINYIFAKNEIDLHVIDHPYFKSHEYFKNIFHSLRLPISYHIITCVTRANGEDDWVGQLNSPYRVDIKKLEDYICTIHV